MDHLSFQNGSQVRSTKVTSRVEQPGSDHADGAQEEDLALGREPNRRFLDADSHADILWRRNGEYPAGNISPAPGFPKGENQSAAVPL